MIWRIDLFRVPRAVSLLGATAGVVAITGLSLALPEEPWEQFQGVNHVSTFVRSGVTTAYELAHQGLDRLRYRPRRISFALRRTNPAIRRSSRRTSSWCSMRRASMRRAVPGIKLPPGYGGHFQSFDGKTRSLIVEGSGGPTWYTEYNVLTGLSARSYGRLELLRHPHCRRPRQPRPAAGAEALRLQDHFALPGLWRVPQRQEIPGDHRRRPLPRLRRHEGRGLRARSLLLRSGACR